VDVWAILPPSLQTTLHSAELFCLEQVLAGKEANFFTLSSQEAKTTQAITYPTEATEHNTLRPEFLEVVIHKSGTSFADSAARDFHTGGVYEW
jgi:hypothetical protein